MRKLWIMIGLLAMLIAPASAGLVLGKTRDLGQWWQLREVRQATAKYHDVDKALADGYIPVSPCEELAGEGAMGMHYMHPALSADQEFDVTRPELLLYLPTKDGVRLVGVEYLAADVGQPRPTVLGQAFDGPMAGHSPGMPRHYDLHVWLWAKNPGGMFAQWNPNLSCAAAQE